MPMLGFPNLVACQSKCSMLLVTISGCSIYERVYGASIENQWIKHQTTF